MGLVGSGAIRSELRVSAHGLDAGVVRTRGFRRLRYFLFKTIFATDAIVLAVARIASRIHILQRLVWCDDHALRIDCLVAFLSAHHRRVVGEWHLRVHVLIVTTNHHVLFNQHLLVVVHRIRQHASMVTTTNDTDSGLNACGVDCISSFGLLGRHADLRVVATPGGIRLEGESGLVLVIRQNILQWATSSRFELSLLLGNLNRVWATCPSD